MIIYPYIEVRYTCVLLFQAIKQTGIRTSDTRLKGCWEKFKTKQKEATGETFSTYRVDKDTFKE